jgi:hypothetical protein
MGVGTVSDLMTHDDPDQIRERFRPYIRENSDAIDRSLSLFFSHVVSALEDGCPQLTDPDYNVFLDEIACEIFRQSSRINDPAFDQELGAILAEYKRNGGRGGLDLVSGLHSIRRGLYHNAVLLLKKYRYIDPLIGSAIAYCYIQAGREEGETDRMQSDPLLSAREQLMAMSEHRPPLVSPPPLSEDEVALLSSLFWDVYEQARQWFPHDEWFPEIALLKAESDGDACRYDSVLTDALTLFPDDIRFLRRAFQGALERGSVESAAVILQRMIRVMPDGVEPVYYGLKLAVITGRAEIFYRFRKQAIIRGIPPYLTHLLEYIFEILRHNRQGAVETRKRFSSLYPRIGYSMDLFTYLEEDIFSGDPDRQKRGMQALLPIVDRFAMNVLKIGEE